MHFTVTKLSASTERASRPCTEAHQSRMNNGRSAMARLWSSLSPRLVVDRLLYVTTVHFVHRPDRTVTDWSASGLCCVAVVVQVCHLQEVEQS